MDCCVCFPVAWQCFDRDVVETRLWSSPAPAGSLLLWEEAGIDSLAQMWQPLLLLPAQQVLLEWARSVSTPAVQSDCIGWGFIFSLPRNCNPQPPHVLDTREPSSGAGVA